MSRSAPQCWPAIWVAGILFVGGCVPKARVVFTCAPHLKRADKLVALPILSSTAGVIWNLHADTYNGEGQSREGTDYFDALTTRSMYICTYNEAISHLVSHFVVFQLPHTLFFCYFWFSVSYVRFDLILSMTKIKRALASSGIFLFLQYLIIRICSQQALKSGYKSLH